MKLVIAPLRTLAVALLLTALMPPPQHASASSIQQEPPPGQEAAPAPLSPIGEGEVLTRADLVEADLRRIEVLMRPADSIVRIDAALSEREADIIAQRGRLDAVDPNSVSTRQLEDQQALWLELQREMVSWSQTVATRFQTLQSERQILREVRTLWALTADEADPEEFSPEMLQRVDATLSRIIDVETRLREKRNEVGSLEARIAAELSLISGALDDISSIGRTMRGRLLVRKGVPLWRAIAAGDAPSVFAEMRDTGQEWFNGLASYIRGRPAPLVSLLLWCGLLLAGMLGIRQKSGAWLALPESSETAQRLIERPFSLAITLALATAVFALPNPVGSAIDVVFLLAAVPVLRLGAVVLGETTRTALYSSFVVALLARFAAAGHENSLTARVMFLLAALLAFGGAVYLVRRFRATGQEQTGRQRLLQVLAAAAAIVFGVALAANIFGWVQLSRVLTEATAVSLFAALGWIVFVDIVAALLPSVVSNLLGSKLPSLRRNQADIQRTTLASVGTVATLLWLRSVLVRFQVAEPVESFLSGVAASEVSVGGLTISTGGVFGAVGIGFATWLIARLVRFVLREEVVPRLGLRRGAGQSAITLINYTIYALGVVMAATALGLQSTQLAVVIGALSLGIGFGLQTIVNNFVSGLILIFERPITVGDIVQTATHWGRVSRIGIRASVIRSVDGAEIVVPNGDLIAKELINWTRSDNVRRIEVLVGVAYGTDPEKVLGILQRVAEEHPETLAHPPPEAQMLLFGDSSLDFRVRCWTTMESWLTAASEMRVNINREFQKAGITIPFPQRDLHLKTTPHSTADEESLTVDSLERSD